MNSNSVDLIYLDPPFNSKKNYAAPIGSEAAGAAFKDSWKLSDLDIAWHNQIADVNPALYGVVYSAGLATDDFMKSYLIMMAVRLIEMERILKPTGSIYLHCDDAASHYLKMLMDAIFGYDNYRNHIIWKRATSHNDPSNYGRILDHILYYSPSDKPIWNRWTIYMPKSKDEIASAYPSQDNRGRYRSADLTGATASAGESGMPWKGYDVASRNRHWSAPKTGDYARYIEHNFIKGYTKIKGIHDRLDALDDAGLIHHPERGFWPGLKRYADADRGNPPQNLILDPIGFTNYNKGRGEFTGYPTQKPLGLLHQIIKASSNRGDVVFDPFCGCATALVSAESLQRQWVGIDISEKAVELVNTRLLQLFDRPMLPFDVIAREDVPQRTDLLPPPSLAQSKQLLYGTQVGNCEGCGVHFEARNLTIDHIVPRSKGGTDHLENLQLLCSACNSLKGNRPMEYLRQRLRRLDIGLVK